MRRWMLMIPAVIILLVGGLVVVAAGEQPSFKSQSMPGNYQFLTIANPSGLDAEGFPAFYGNGPQQIVFHLDLSGQNILDTSVVFMVQVVSSDWTRTLYTQNFTYTQATDFMLNVPNLDYGTYALVVYMGQKPTYWQLFSVDSQTGQSLGYAVVLVGIILALVALYPEKMGRYH